MKIPKLKISIKSAFLLSLSVLVLSGCTTSDDVFDSDPVPSPASTTSPTEAISLNEIKLEGDLCDGYTFFTLTCHNKTYEDPNYPNPAIMKSECESMYTEEELGIDPNCYVKDATSSEILTALPIQEVGGYDTYVFELGDKASDTQEILGVVYSDDGEKTIVDSYTFNFETQKLEEESN